MNREESKFPAEKKEAGQQGLFNRKNRYGEHSMEVSGLTFVSKVSQTLKTDMANIH